MCPSSPGSRSSRLRRTCSCPGSRRSPLRRRSPCSDCGSPRTSARSSGISFACRERDTRSVLAGGAAPAVRRRRLSVEKPMTREEKVARFRALHAAPRAFVIPNPWDAGSSRVLAGLGYAALATSSGACAGVLGRRDGRVTREEALSHAQAIVAAVDLPVSADLEKCFADAPREAAETIRLAAEAGLAGGSIEDASGDRDKPIFDFNYAVERVAAAAEVAKKIN